MRSIGAAALRAASQTSPGTIDLRERADLPLTHDSASSPRTVCWIILPSE